MSALRKKRKHINDEDVDDEEDILVHSSDDDDIVEGMPSSSASKKQRKLPHNTLESNKKKPVTHHKPARALNDAFKDFQSNFGLSSPSASTAEGEIHAMLTLVLIADSMTLFYRFAHATYAARSTPSIHKVKQSGFKSSFGNDAPASKLLFVLLHPLHVPTPQIPSS